MTGSAVLFSEMTPAGGDAAVFEQWYGAHHGPGVLSVRPYKSEAGPHYLAVFVLGSADAAPDPDMAAPMSGLTRYVAAEASLRGDGLDAEFIHCMLFNVPMCRWKAAPPSSNGSTPSMRPWCSNARAGRRRAGWMCSTGSPTRRAT